MAGRWYCRISGQTSDPLSPQQLKALADQGKLGPNDLVRQGDEGPWIPAVCVKGLMSAEGSSSTLPEETARPVAETVRRGPAKYSGRSGAKPAAPRKAKSLPVARPMDEPPAARPKPRKVAQAAPRPAPARPARSPAPSGPLVVDPITESATHRALGRTVPSPRKRQRNNLLAVAILSVMAIGLGIAGVVLLASRDGVDNTADDKTTAAKGDGKKDGQQPAKDATAGQKAGGDPAEQPETTADQPGSGSPDSTTPRSPDDRQWVDASRKAIHRDNVRVQLRSVRIDTPPGEAAVTPGKFLLIIVEVQNTSATKELRFISWSGTVPLDQPVTLTDNTGKSYRQRAFGDEDRPPGPEEADQPDNVPEVSARHLRPGSAARVGAYENRGVVEVVRVRSTPTLAQFEDGADGDILPGGRTKEPERNTESLEEALDRYQYVRRPVAVKLPAAGSVEDLLIFERPDEEVRYLRLTLPAGAFGSKGTLNFLIPGKMIKTAGEPESSTGPSDSGKEKPAKPDAKTPGPGETPPDEKLDPGEEEFKKLFEEELSGDGKEGEGFESMIKKPSKPDPNKSDKKEKAPKGPGSKEAEDDSPAKSRPTPGDRDGEEENPFK